VWFKITSSTKRDDDEEQARKIGEAEQGVKCAVCAACCIWSLPKLGCLDRVGLLRGSWSGFDDAFSCVESARSTGSGDGTLVLSSAAIRRVEPRIVRIEESSRT
jgi:hypothetical protein